MNEKAIRWRQRFENLSKAFDQFKAAVDDIENLSPLEKEGLVQRFEYTFELSWKTLKDFLESQEVEAKFPRDVIKSAFRYEILDDGEAWMQMLEERNLMAHTYNEKIFNEVVSQITTYFYPHIASLMEFFKKQV